jgi:uncharacterized protein (TIGR03545 family)
MEGKNKKIKTKKLGFIRWEAVIPFVIVTVLGAVYFKLFFDSHLKSALEFGGYHAVGAEVNIGSLETSFLQGTFRVRNIQVTDPARPTHNMFEIGDIRFAVLWDGLLRARVVIDEMAAEQIKLQSPRKSPGKVKPPSPKKEDGPSLVEELKDQALDKIQDQYNENLLGDLAALLSGTSSQEQLSKIEGNIEAKKMIAELETALKEKEKSWKARIDALPKGPEIEALGQRLKAIKTKDFKDAKELETSIKEFNAVIKEADQKVKTVDGTATDLQKELKALEGEFLKIEHQIKADIAELEARFKLPRLDAASLTQALLRPYIDPYIGKFQYYNGLFEKYAPPNIVSKVKGQPATRDPQFQPRPRAKGVSYEFGKPNSYPAFWIRKISISSQAGANPFAGEVRGLITNITSNQTLINRATEAKVFGDFPGLQVRGSNLELTIDSRPAETMVKLLSSVDSYRMGFRSLLDSKDAKIEVGEMTGRFTVAAEVVGFKQISLTAENFFKPDAFNVSSPHSLLQQILQPALAQLPDVSIKAKVRGQLLKPRVSLDSNLGRELSRALEKQLALQLQEAKRKVEEYVRAQVTSEKQKIETQLNTLKARFQNEVQKVKSQLDTEKTKAESQLSSIKKESENQAQRKIEEEAKKLLGKDGDKKLEELKKKLKIGR